MVRLWPLAREDSTVSDPWIRDASRMVIASLFGFVIAAQFVTIKHLEIPYYVALVGVGVLSLPVPEAPRGPPVWFSPSFRRPRPHSMSAV